MTHEAIYLPDTGSTSALDVIEILVKVGDTVSVNQALLTLESDKATLDVPAPKAGIIKSLHVKIGDKIKTGDLVAEFEADAASASPTIAVSTASSASSEAIAPVSVSTAIEATPKAPTAVTEKPVPTAVAVPQENTKTQHEDIYAGPSVRRMARLLGVDLSSVRATGDKGRITKDDIRAHVKALVTQAQQATPAQGGGMGLPTMPVTDFSQYGPIETKPLSRIKKLTAQNLSRNWLLAPHVTQFEDADITDMEAFRKSQGPAYDKLGIKLTPLVFIMKAAVQALKAAPTFNASLDASGDNLILKNYFHIGIAVDTPEGLVVPVIRDVDQKSLSELAAELAEVGTKARGKKLTAQDMQGSCFTISSLGGIGGTAFTPIINLPNVAILGVSKAAIKPVWDGQLFAPRLILPLSLSYDHRVIDGAEAARFIVTMAKYLKDIRLMLL